MGPSRSEVRDRFPVVTGIVQIWRSVPGLVHRVPAGALADVYPQGMTDVSQAVVGSYPSGSGERVWVALPHMPMAEAVDVEAWAVLADGTVSPIAARLDGTPRALVEFAWARELDALAGMWVDQLPRLPLLPAASTINGVPVARFDASTVVLGSVGLGNEVWGPYTILDEQIVTGLDLVPELMTPETHDELSYLLPGARIDCRVTWSESSFIEMDPVAMILLEPADGHPPL